MVKQINENMIREAAYFAWENDGRPEGRSEFYWMKACEQFFKPAKVAVKKPAKKVVKKEAPKKVAPVKPAASVVAAKTVKPAPKAVVKPAVKQAKKTVAPVFYGARK